MPAAHGVVRWRLIDLARWVFDEFAIAISQPHALAAQIARAQPGRKHLAVHAGKLAVQPGMLRGI